MMGHLKTGIIGLAMAALFVFPALPAEAQEASGRFRVFVPDLKPLDESNKRFGERAASTLRERIDNLVTHTPVPDREVRDALRQFRLRMEDLNCIQARQLASQIKAELVMCGDYRAANGEFVLNASFVNVENGETFDVNDLRVPSGNERAGAEAIYQAFETFVDQTRTAVFCRDYHDSQQWDNALTACNRALELNPTALSVLFLRGRTYMETDRLEEALQDFQAIIELNPVHEVALQNAAYVSAQLGETDQARRYYSDYLELNPGNVQVRMRVAYDLAQAGDPFGAMRLVEEGLNIDPENVELHRQIGNFAFAAAGQAIDLARLSDSEGNGMTSEVRELYTRAIESYERVFAAEGAETPASQLRNIVAAHIQLEDLQSASSMAERALEAHPDDARLWSVYGDVLQRQGQVDRAIAALDQVMRIEPDYPNVAARQGRWLLDAGRTDEGIAALRNAVQRGEQTPDAVANVLFADGYQNGHQKQNHAHAIAMYEQAKSFGVSPQMRAQLDFFHGFSLLQRGIAVQQPQTAASARQALPMFQQARRLIEAGRPYAATTTTNVNELLGNVDQFIDIQEALIRRG